MLASIEGGSGAASGGGEVPDPASVPHEEAASATAVSRETTGASRAGVPVASGRLASQSGASSGVASPVSRASMRDVSPSVASARRGASTVRPASRAASAGPVSSWCAAVHDDAKTATALKPNTMVRARTEPGAGTGARWCAGSVIVRQHRIHAMMGCRWRRASCRGAEGIRAALRSPLATAGGAPLR